jgi:transcriptional regulator with XRE-family HTH domain
MGPKAAGRGPRNSIRGHEVSDSDTVSPAGSDGVLAAVMSETDRIVDTLKRALKSRGMTYAALAAQIGLSEASIKRIFSERTLTLTRLESICAALNLTVQEVTRLAGGGPGDAAGGVDTLTEAQEAALAADPQLLACFHLLANGHTPREVATALEADAKLLRRWLSRLDALGLLALQPKQRVRLRVGSAINWRRNGPVRRLYEQQVREEFLRGDFTAAGESLQFRSAELSEPSRQIMQRRIDRLVAEFADLAELDRRLPGREKRSTGMLIAMRPWVLSMFRSLLKR